MKKPLLINAGFVVALAMAFVAWQQVPHAVVFSERQAHTLKKDSGPLLLTFTPHSSEELLALARSAVKSAVDGKPITYNASDNPQLQVRAGCFVTLKNKEILRGCIGRFTAEEPLWRTVPEVAASSARMDVRFTNNPISSAEVPHLEIEISVLSPMRRISRPFEEIELGRDGIVIMDKGHSGTFLPQVARETGWTLEEFLSHCARDKAGLAWDGWKSPTARILGYSATIIREKDFTADGRK